MMMPTSMMMMQNPNAVPSSGQQLQQLHQQHQQQMQQSLQLQQMQQQNMQQQQQQQQQQQMHQQQDAVDPVTKFRQLLPRLKETLQKLLLSAAHIFNQNVLVDGCMKNVETQMPRFDKSLEEFYAICDQIELNLRLAIDVMTQNAEAQRYVPMMAQVAVSQSSQQPDSIPYPQYLNTIKMQLTCAQDIHDSLVECAKQIMDRQNIQAPATV
jgi:signal recognition particle GTPase